MNLLSELKKEERELERMSLVLESNLAAAHAAWKDALAACLAHDAKDAELSERILELESEEN